MRDARELVDYWAEAIVDKAVPRAMVGLAFAGVTVFGAIEAPAGAESSDRQHNADVEACARMLGEQATHVRSADMPGDCEQFETSFSFHETTVRVVGPAIGSTPSFKRTRTYDLPKSSDFRGANVKTDSEISADKSNEKEAVLIVGGGLTALMWGGFTWSARARRRQEEKQAKKAAEAGAA